MSIFGITWSFLGSHYYRKWFFPSTGAASKPCVVLSELLVAAGVALRALNFEELRLGSEGRQPNGWGRMAEVKKQAEMELWVIDQHR